jgi:hypothetical protein
MSPHGKGGWRRMWRREQMVPKRSRDGKKEKMKGGRRREEKRRKVVEKEREPVYESGTVFL